MVQVTHQAVAGYKLDMQSVIVNWVRGGEDVITQTELAQQMRGRVTQAFRRRIAELQTEGLVTRFTYRTDKGGYAVAYQIHRDLVGNEHA